MNKNYLKAKENFFIENVNECGEEKKLEFKKEFENLKGKNVYKDPIDTVYRYYFEEENSVYVGRTIYPNLRDHQHRVRKNDTVLKFAKEKNKGVPKMEILEENLTVEQGVEREKYWANYYKENGFKLINKHPCGSVGHMAQGKWTKEKCFEEGRKYALRSKFQRGSSQAYHIAMKNGWIDEMDWLPKKETKPNGYWKNKENIIAEAKKYTKRKDFEEQSPSAFVAANRYGVMAELTWLEKEERLPFNYWKDKDHVIEEAKKYSSKKEFQTKNQSAYWAALKYGYIDEIPWLVKRKSTPHNYWKNKELVFEEAKKYKSKADFIRGNRNAYEAAHRYGFIDEMDWFKKK